MLTGMRKGFTFLDEIVSGVRWDAKYATWDNFTGKPVDGYESNRIAGTCELAAALLKVKDAAAAKGYGLLLWDGYRPQRAVNCFIKWSEQ
jgi:D-alanyl-D-alanine dipeptidase